MTAYGTVLQNNLLSAFETKWLILSEPVGIKMAAAMTSNETDLEYTHEELSMWNVTALKEYLKVRNLPHSKKTKAELISLVYGSMHLNYQPVKTAVELEMQAKSEYSQLLTTEDGTVLVDPLTIQHWSSEKESIPTWPKVLFSDLIMYVKKTNSALSADMYSRYKQGKAYGYFADDWVSTLSYHLDASSDVAYFKTVCRPSERLSATPHSVWLACTQSTGEMLSAWCSCTAG